MDESNRFISHNNHKPTPRKEMKTVQDDPDMQCGVGPCKPKSLQCCGNIKCFTMFYSLAGLCTSTISMYVTSQLTTLEKYFGFSSSQSGFLMSCNDIGFLLTILIVSHLARRVHIPRVLSISTIFFGISGIFCTLSYFLSPTFMTGTQGQLTDEEETGSSNVSILSMIEGGQLCEEKDSHKCNITQITKVKIGAPTQFTPIALTILAIGMILQGFAKSPRQPFVTCYIDDNVKKTSTGMYLGVVMALSIFGPAIAFGLGGFFTHVYVTLEDVSITPRDPRWIGAWWIGFLLFGFISLLSGIPLFFFPRRYKPKPEDWTDKSGRGLLQNFKDILKGVCRLLTNKLYMLVTLSNCVVLFTVGAMVPFLPKYMEVQFQLPAWTANIVMGAIGVFAAATGSFLGGCILTKFKLSPVSSAKLILGISLFSILIPFAGLFLGCDNPTINGFSSPRNFSSLPSDQSNCTSDCFCDDSDYFPVCGSDGNNYFSPCHAGCSEQQGLMFKDCGCIGVNGTATPGLCQSQCKMFTPYAAISFFGGLIGATAALPSIIFSIRCVTDKEKSLAIGLSTFLQTLLGWFAGPIVMGVIVDTSCRRWSTSCQGQGACSMYDLEDLRIKRHVFEIAAKTIVVFMHIAMFLLAKRTDWSRFQREENIPGPEKESLMISAENGKRNYQWTLNGDPIVKKK